MLVNKRDRAIVAGVVCLAATSPWPLLAENVLSRSTSVNSSIGVGSLLSYPFLVDKNEPIHIRVVNATTAKTRFRPQSWLYGPAGQVVAHRSRDKVMNFDCFSSSHSCRFKQSGIHRLVVADEDGAYTGNIRIEILYVNTPGAALKNHGGASGQESVLIQSALREYQDSFEGGRFHTKDAEQTDGLDYLGGQCIAWSRLLYDKTAAKSLSSLTFGAAANIPNVLEQNGFHVVKEATKPKVGSLIVWDDGGAGHVGVVSAIKQGPLEDGAGPQIIVSEANFAKVTAQSASNWGVSLEEAKREFITEEYGVFKERVFDTNELSRGRYTFSAYVYP
jgi:surface antigen